MRDRLPFRPLADVAGRLPLGELAKSLGVAARTVHRWRATDTVPPMAADRAAVALGHHPAEIWPEWGTDADR